MDFIEGWATIILQSPPFIPERQEDVEIMLKGWLIDYFATHPDEPDVSEETLDMYFKDSCHALMVGNFLFDNYLTKMHVDTGKDKPTLKNRYISIV